MGRGRGGVLITLTSCRMGGYVGLAHRWRGHRYGCVGVPKKTRHPGVNYWWRGRRLHTLDINSGIECPDFFLPWRANWADWLTWIIDGIQQLCQCLVGKEREQKRGGGGGGVWEKESKQTSVGSVKTCCCCHSLQSVVTLSLFKYDSTAFPIEKERGRSGDRESKRELKGGKREEGRREGWRMKDLPIAIYEDTFNFQYLFQTEYTFLKICCTLFHTIWLPYRKACLLDNLRVDYRMKTPEKSIRKLKEICCECRGDENSVFYHEASSYYA